MTKKDFIIKLFQHCHLSGIKIAFARPYGSNFSQQRDFDVLINGQQLNLILQWIREQSGIAITSAFERQDGHSIFLYGFADDNNKALAIDFITSLTLKGISYLKLSEVLVRSDNGIMDPMDQALLLFMTAIKHQGNLKNEYADFIIAARKQADTAFRQKTVELFGGALGIDVLESYDRMTGKLDSHAALRRACVFRGLLHDPVRAALSLLGFACKEMICRLSAPLTSIAFYGIDGAGKTTLINAVKSELQGTVKMVRHCHFLPLFPWQQEPDSNITISDPHKKPVRGFVTSTLKIFYYVCYCWAACLWPRRGSVLFLYDRYVPDMLVDPKRLRYGGPAGLLRWSCRLLPQPNLSVIVAIDPAQAVQRKSELPLAEAVRQNNDYINILSEMPGAITVRGDLPLSVNSTVVINHYLKIGRS